MLNANHAEVISLKKTVFILAKITPLVLITLAILFKGKIILNFYKKIWILSLIFFSIIVTLSSLFSNDAYLSYKTLFIILCLTLPLILFLDFITSVKKFEYIVRVISIIYICFSFYILYVEFILSSQEMINDRSLVGGYSKGSVSNFVLLGLSLIFVEKNLFRLILLITSVLLIYVSLSVKLYIIFFIFLFLSFFSLKKNNLISLLVLTTILLCLYYLFPIGAFLNYVKIFNPQIYFFVIERILVLFGSTNVGDYAYYDTLGNFDLRLNSLKLFINSPIIGIGLENERLSEIGTQAHSAFISILVGSGLLGFVSYYFISIYIFFKSLKYKYYEVFKLIFMYLSYSIANPTYSNGPASLLYFLIICLFILNREENLNRS